jgi:hypothetical protein
MVTMKHPTEPDCPVEAGGDCVVPTIGWRKFDTSIVVFIAGIIISLLLWAGGPNGVNSHFTSIDTVLVQHTKDDQSTEKRVDVLERKTDERLKSIDDKLDRLIERRR